MSFLSSHKSHLDLIANTESIIEGFTLNNKDVYLHVVESTLQETGLIKNIGIGYSIFEIATMAYDNNKYYVLSGSFIEYDDITGNLYYTGGETLDKLCVKIKYTKTQEE